MMDSCEYRDAKEVLCQCSLNLRDGKFSLVRGRFPHNVNLADEDTTSHGHGNGDDGEVDPCELDTPNADMLPPQNITPQETS